ncbi:MAG: hypothetical protein ACRD1V_02730 [Vicinamibacterales bacterium]
MFKPYAAALLVVAGSFATLDAQKSRPAPPQGMPDPAQMQAAMDAAQKNAKRPGDEVMSCDALQTELVADMQDPKLQAVAAKQGAWAKDQQDKLNAANGANAAGPSKGSIAAQMAKSFATSMIPGAGMAQMAGQQAQIQAQMAQAAQNQAAMMENMTNMMTIMPQMMRGQRLVELGQAKNCEWASNGGPSK